MYVTLKQKTQFELEHICNIIEVNASLDSKLQKFERMEVTSNFK